MTITRSYFEEKIEAYDVAISALEEHEPASDGDKELAWRLRMRLATKLKNEIQRWVNAAKL